MNKLRKVAQPRLTTKTKLSWWATGTNLKLIVYSDRGNIVLVHKINKANGNACSIYADIGMTWKLAVAIETHMTMT